MRFLSALLRRIRSDPEWRPVSYEQAIAMPYPVFRNISEALTPDGHLVALHREEAIGPDVVDERSYAMQEGARQVREMWRGMG